MLKKPNHRLLAQARQIMDEAPAKDREAEAWAEQWWEEHMRASGRS
jgi:hypothetical protein